MTTLVAPLRVMTVDDEPHARRRLDILLRGQPGVELVGAAAGGISARQMIADLVPDVVLLSPEAGGARAPGRRADPRP